MEKLEANSATRSLLHLPPEVLTAIARWLQTGDLIHFMESHPLIREACSSGAQLRSCCFEGCYFVDELTFERFLKTSAAPFIQNLNINFCHWISPQILKKCLTKCHQLKVLHAFGVRLSTTSLADIISKLPKLETLAFSCDSVSDLDSNIFKDAIETLKHLRIIHIFDEKNTSKKLRGTQMELFLNFCPSLEGIFVYASAVRRSVYCGAPMVEPPEMPLKCLKHVYVQSGIESTVCAFIERWLSVEQLQALEVDKCKTWHAYEQFHSIVMLSTEGDCNINTSDSANWSLESLHIERTVAESYTFFSKHCCLKSLTFLHIDPMLYDTSPTEWNLSWLTQCRRLKYFILKQGAPRRDFYEVLQFSYELRILQHLSSCPLEALNVLDVCLHRHTYESVPQSPCAIIAQLTGLKHLSMCACLMLPCGANAHPPRDLTRPSTSDSDLKHPLFGRKRKSTFGAGPDDGAGYSKAPSAFLSLVQRTPGMETFVMRGWNICPLFSGTVRDSALGSMEEELNHIAQWRHLSSLTLAQIPCVLLGGFLVKIARCCPRLSFLSLDSLGLAGRGLETSLKQALPLMAQLKHLRVSQDRLPLSADFWEAIGKCKNLERLLVMALNSKLQPVHIIKLMDELPRMAVLLLFCSVTDNVRKKLSRDIKKRYGGRCPGLHVTISRHRLASEEVGSDLRSIPTKHLIEMVDFGPKVCARPPYGLLDICWR